MDPQLNLINHNNSTYKIQKISCADCGEVDTSAWRIREDGYKVCNSCGLYRKKYGIIHPTIMDPQLNLINHNNSTYKIQKISCADCGEVDTSAWRIREDGYKVCNSCGLYRKKYGIIHPTV
ncbi:hypothetical protein Glove_38g37 [Diversispora epigaea]|uniref:GATA-type domain-containing protein n=1 Tax=Diversispora epigaea TaxID=1348612 RepID=A0A397JI52_9GLOM|nr:hypothetical protein Glove_38g37 [Diversispora epigaea]